MTEDDVLTYGVNGDGSVLHDLYSWAPIFEYRIG